MISIFTAHTSPRLTYIAQQVFTEWLNQEIQWFNDVKKFESAQGIKINYSDKTITADIHIKPQGLLFETGIQKKRPEVGKVKDIPVLFPASENHVFPFDFLSAAFWMLSRMEEYEFEEQDRFQRFSAQQSLAHLAGFLETPVIDVWIQLLLEVLPEEKRNSIHTDAFKFTCTIDVDNAYAIYGKPYWRQVLASARDLMRGKPGYIAQRWKIWNGKAPDPYDTYAFIEETTVKYRTPVTFFYLLGDYSKRDKNLSWESEILRKVIRSNMNWSKTGIHPSFSSYANAKIIQRDVQRLKDIGGVRVNQSRQHYLRCRFPYTFQYLLEAGIRMDYTLGFHDLPGYRAGTGRPFYFYDITIEKETELVLQPFVMMDGTFHDYMKISSEKALEKTEEIFSTAKKYGTPVCTLWHNDTVNDQGIWKGWRKVFLRQFELAK
jgi:hypothetical protein